MTPIPYTIKTIKHKKGAMPYIIWGLIWDLKSKRGDPDSYINYHKSHK